MLAEKIFFTNLTANASRDSVDQFAALARCFGSQTRRHDHKFIPTHIPAT